VFDSSVGGLGGCPYAKGAKGNVATEDLVYCFHGMGVRTGVDLDKLVDIGEWISQTLNRRNESRAGAAIYAKRTPAKEESKQTASSATTSTSTSSETLIVKRNQSTSTITLNNPSKGNVLTAAMVELLRSTMSSLSSDPTIQTIVLTNTGKYFCTGMDLSATGPATTGTTKAQLQNLLSTFECVNTSPKTTIALIKGSCFGGGVGLAFCCDIRIVVGKDKKFILSEVKRGLVPATISKYVVREWGPALAREAMITGRPIPASELLHKHVIHELVETDEEAQEKVDQYTTLMKSSAPRAVSQVKDLVNAVAERKGESEAIERIFIDMMRPSDEAKHGIEEFRKGNREVDWAAWYREQNSMRGKSKL
jgi:hydroxymethylglutaryl-CoA lyase